MADIYEKLNGSVEVLYSTGSFSDAPDGSQYDVNSAIEPITDLKLLDYNTVSAILSAVSDGSTNVVYTNAYYFEKTDPTIYKYEFGSPPVDTYASYNPDPNVTVINNLDGSSQTVSTSNTSVTYSSTAWLDLGYVPPPTITFDNVTPLDSTGPAPNFILDRNVILSGTVSEDTVPTTVAVFNSGTYLGSAQLNGNNWSLSAKLKPGTNNFSATAFDAANQQTVANYNGPIITLVSEGTEQEKNALLAAFNILVDFSKEIGTISVAVDLTSLLNRYINPLTVIMSTIGVVIDCGTAINYYNTAILSAGNDSYRQYTAKENLFIGIVNAFAKGVFNFSKGVLMTGFGNIYVASFFLTPVPALALMIAVGTLEATSNYFGYGPDQFYQQFIEPSVKSAAKWSYEEYSPPATSKGGHSYVGGTQDGLIYSASPNDVFTTTHSSETFVFTPNYGHNDIRHFYVSGENHDILDLSNIIKVNTMKYLLSISLTTEGNTTITLSPHYTITLDGVTKTEIKANPSSFILHAHS